MTMIMFSIIFLNIFSKFKISCFIKMKSFNAYNYCFFKSIKNSFRLLKHYLES